MGRKRLDANCFRPRAHPGKRDLRPRREEPFPHAQRVLSPSRGYAWSRSAPVVPLALSSRPGKRARLPGPRPFPSAPGTPRLSLFELVPDQAPRVVVCEQRRRSAGDAGAARAARADRPYSAVPLSSRLLGPVAESPVSPSHTRSPRRAPEARGGPRSPGECWPERETNGRDRSLVGEGRGLESRAGAGSWDRGLRVGGEVGVEAPGGEWRVGAQQLPWPRA